MMTRIRSRLLPVLALATLGFAGGSALADVHASSSSHSSGGGGHASSNTGGGHAAPNSGGSHGHAAYGGRGHGYYGGNAHGFYGSGRYAGGYAPHGGYAFTHDGQRYWYRGGQWYGWRGSAWFFVEPPFGIWLPFLPLYYSSFWWGGYPYYYADAVYYRPSDRGTGYEVVEPPPGAPTESGSATIFVYPREGQSPEMQSKDRYECHRWAADQTGFDPTQSGGGVAPTDNTPRRADYERAESACLEARGYTVK